MKGFLQKDKRVFNALRRLQSLPIYTPQEVKGQASGYLSSIYLFCACKAVIPDTVMRGCNHECILKMIDPINWDLFYQTADYQINLV
jgi:hypothetical protein